MPESKLYSLADAVKILAATTPPVVSKIQKEHSVGRANARISELETALGVDHGNPTFNILRANRRIEHLENLLAQKNVGTLPPVAPAADASVVAPTIAPVTKAIATIPAVTTAARPVELTGSNVIDGAVAAAGVHTLAELKVKMQRTRLEAAAAALTPGSLSRRAVEANIAKLNARS